MGQVRLQTDRGPLATDGDTLGLRAGILALLRLKLAEGTNATMGRATLVAGTKTVNTSKITAASEVFLTCQSVGGTQGMLSVGTRVAGTSFVINSSNSGDTSVIAWVIVEPA